LRCVIHPLIRVLHLNDMVMKWLTRNAPRPLHGWLCVPAAAVVLLIVLGVLQFRWLSELSSHDRERRHAHLVTDTRRFAEDFDRELTRVYFNFQTDGVAIERNDARGVLIAYELWKKSTPYPGLIRDIWFTAGRSPPVLQRGSIEASAAPGHLLRLDMAKGRFVEAQASPVLAGLLPRLNAPPAQTAVAQWPVDLLSNPMDEETLSILVPLIDQMPIPEPLPQSSGNSAFSGAVEVPAPRVNFLIVQLDRNYVLRELLPALAHRYFSSAPHSEDLEYQVVIHNPATRRVVYASDPRNDGRVPATFDATASLLAIRFSTSRLISSSGVVVYNDNGGNGQTGPTAGVAAGSGRDVQGRWQVSVTHRSGSLEALAIRTRHQNFFLSSIILALLAGSFVLTLVALRRARALERQQMEFVAGVSHELRTPVAVVCMTGANLADGLVSDPGQIRHYGRLIQDKGRLLTEMIEQVLSFAHTENQPRPVLERAAIDVLIQHALHSMQTQLQELGFKISVTVDTSLPPVRVDKASIERAIQNLISNALKYSVEHRAIHITAGVDARRDVVWIAVEDHGIGIFPDELSLIFEPFRRGRGAVEHNLPGTGLGLSLVRRIMQAHGGDVRVRSEPDVGSTFTLHLPVAKNARLDAR